MSSLGTLLNLVVCSWERRWWRNTQVIIDVRVDLFFSFHLIHSSDWLEVTVVVVVVVLAVVVLV